MAAASRLTSIWAAASIPAAGFFLGRVYADGNKVHPMELDIYDKSVFNQEVIMQEPPTDIEIKVSTGRKKVFSYWDSAKGLVGKGQSLAETANDRTTEFMALLSTDQTFQIKVAVISSGVLIGAILAGRGKRRIRRTIYSVGLGTAAASVCYPQKAWIVSQKVYEKTKVLLMELKSMYDEQKKKQMAEVKQEKFKSELIKEEEVVAKPIEVVTPADEMKIDELIIATTEEEMPVLPTIKEVDITPISSALETKESDKSYLSNVPFLGWFFKSKKPVIIEATENAESVVGNVVEESREQSKKTEVVEDHGQSNPEDKDMYSTRS
ncbi:uncharacterized protein LOC116293192 [Actinia tenebrosa]|uniref:MICOS complex subunit n=1 Tax=Actinia tenebrosa TaxID=6105 RepID=A0A6P8HJ88_ACTTE|nr:uncharacterized protein LOC116293192 [Actinia tenebrosa]